MTTFPEYILQKLQEFERAQGRRVSLDAFAEYIGVSRPLISYWINGKTKPSLENVKILAARFGPEVYDVLGMQRPDENLEAISRLWQNLSPPQRQALREQAERYATGEEAKTEAAEKSGFSA